MKKTAAVLAALFILTFTVFPLGASASYTIREERENGEAVSFVSRYPRIYGLADARAQYRINRYFLDFAAYASDRAAYLAALYDTQATGELIAEQTYNGRGLICFCLTQSYEGYPSYSNQTYHTMDLKTGSRLYFWELFAEGGAKREAVTRIFRAEALQRGEPDSQWVSEKLKSIGSAPFFLCDDGTLTVILGDETHDRTLIAVGLHQLAPLMKPEYAPE